jgi:hypothetical protein
MRNRWKAGMAVVMATTMLVSCRSETIWSGAAFLSDGTLQVAAEQPGCGCLTLRNTSAEPILLRSTLRGATSGGARINAGKTRQFRFDWAGPRPDDRYIVEAMDLSGNELDISQKVFMEARPVDCNSEVCIFDTLLLNVAFEEEQ